MQRTDAMKASFAAGLDRFPVHPERHKVANYQFGIHQLPDKKQNPRDLKSLDLGHAGSSPAPGTSSKSIG